MTACVNNEKEIKGGVSHKVLRSVVAGVLAVSMVPTAAFAAEPEGASADLLAATEGTNNFADGEFVWSVEKNDEGKYVVEAGDSFYLTSVADVFGTPYSVSDVTVVYLDYNGTISYTDENDGFTKFSATPYDTKGTRKVVVFDKAIDLSKCTKWGDVIKAADGAEHLELSYTVVSKPLTGSYFYEGDDTSDTSFKYTGTVKDINLADAEGNPIASSQYTVTLADFDNASSFTAGTHTVTVTGNAGTAYEGSVATVRYTVDPIDLAKDTFTIDVVAKGTLFTTTSPASTLDNTSVIYVNGEKLADGAVDAAVSSCLYIVDGELVSYPDMTSITGGASGVYTLDITAPAGQEGNFVNASASGSAEMTVVDRIADVYYGTEDFSDWGTNAATLKTFVTSEGQAFDDGAFTAWKGATTSSDNEVACAVTVTKGGQAVTDYSEPGTYTATVEVKVPSDFAYGAKVTRSFKVVANQFDGQPTVYWQLPGGSQTEEYTGEAIVPQIVVKADGETLAAGEDYAVSYKDADGDAVESPVEPGDYTAVVDFQGSYYKTGLAGTAPCGKVEFEYTIDKALIESAKADKEVYAYTGEAVSPTFTAWTEDDLTGLSVAIDPAKTPVTYYETEVTNPGNDNVYGTEDDVWTDSATPIKAADLKDEGFYVAKVTAPYDDPHFKGTVTSERFEVREYAKFEDVDASEWYADPVYKARDNGYMSGIAGTKLFMPNTDITREQVAAVMFNMAGQTGSAGIYFPTRFSDVDGLAWYAEPISWASQAGVMNGYAGTDVFGVSENATREEVACIFYNYAKAQGKDVTVEDADATLATMADGKAVSDWAKEAVAWAVENGVMGNAGSVWAQNPISRAEVAAMAVNFQPEALK